MEHMSVDFKHHPIDKSLVDTARYKNSQVRTNGCKTFIIRHSVTVQLWNIIRFEAIKALSVLWEKK